MHVRKTRAIGIHGEHRASARTATIIRRPIKGVARKHQTAQRTGSIAVGKIRRKSCRKTMQVREGLRHHLAR
jgi:hypothetical protein